MSIDQVGLKDAMTAELRRRLHEMAADHEGDAFGPFAAPDWIFIAVALIVLPLLATWWFA